MRVTPITTQGYGATDSDYRPDRWDNFREQQRLSGKVDDIEVGLVYFGARYYSPNLQRWLSADPLTIHGFASNFNPYSYVGGAPTQAVDPFGLCNDPSCEGGGSIWDPFDIGGIVGSAICSVFNCNGSNGSAGTTTGSGGGAGNTSTTGQQKSIPPGTQANAGSGALDAIKSGAKAYAWAQALNLTRVAMLATYLTPGVGSLIDATAGILDGAHQGLPNNETVSLLFNAKQAITNTIHPGPNAPLFVRVIDGLASGRDIGVPIVLGILGGNASAASEGVAAIADAEQTPSELASIRQAYVNDVESLSDFGNSARAAGQSTQDTARMLVDMRNGLKLQYRALTGC